MSVQYSAKLAALRRATSLTQLKVAELAGLNRVYVSRLETGALHFRATETRRGLAQAYGLPLHVFDDYLQGDIGLAEVIARRGLEPSVVNRPYASLHEGEPPDEDQDAGLFAPIQGPVHRGWRKLRAGESNLRTGIVLDADEIDGNSDLDLRIEERFRRERIEGGAHIPLGECNEDAIYLEGGE